MFKAEIWLPVAGYEDTYEVSDYGRVRRLTGYRRATWPGRMLKTYLTTHYPSVGLWRSNTRSTAYVHRLVAAAFLGPPPSPSHEVNHLDGVRTNNHVNNLDWTTSSGNKLHAYTTGLTPDRRLARGDRHGNSKLTDAQVEQIRAAPASVRSVDLAREMGVSISLISKIRLGHHRLPHPP
jgi:hypothetical protein